MSQVCYRCVTGVLQVSVLPLAAAWGRFAAAAGTGRPLAARAACTLAVNGSYDLSECRGRIYTVSCDRQQHVQIQTGGELKLLPVGLRRAPYLPASLTMKLKRFTILMLQARPEKLN